MPSLFRRLQSDSDILLKTILISISVVFISVAFYLDTPETILRGLETIIFHPDKLITDYVYIAGWGATFVNAGLLMMIAMGMLHYQKIPITGISIAAILLMGGFGMFGKNIANIWTILFGTFLYSKFTDTKYSQYIYIAFFGTALAPLTTEVIIFSNSYILGMLVGVVIGFLLPPVSMKSLQVHQGYNLYNVGLATGIIGTILISLLRSFSYTPEAALFWYNEYQIEVIVLVYILFIILLVIGSILEPNIIKKYRHVMRHSGRLVADFVVLDGVPVVLFNMGLLGIVYTSFMLSIGAVLNGPILGGILTIVGFAGFGKHIRNTIPIVLGVVLGTFVKVWNIHDPSVLLGMLFGTGLAPIAGQFGLIAGIIAGFMHLSLVLVTSSWHGWTNLYNNGLSAGIICLFLVPVIEMFKDEKERRKDEIHKEEIIEDNG